MRDNKGMFIEVTPEQHKKIKMLAISRGQSLRQLILDAIENLEVEESCKSKEHVFNIESEQALKDYKSGKGVKVHKNIEEFFKKHKI